VGIATLYNLSDIICYIADHSFNFSLNRAFKDQKLLLRRSFGASESESEDDGDDDDETLSCISCASKPALVYPPLYAISDKPFYEPSETGTIATLDAERCCIILLYIACVST